MLPGGVVGAVVVPRSVVLMEETTAPSESFPKLPVGAPSPSCSVLAVSAPIPALVPLTLSLYVVPVVVAVGGGVGLRFVLLSGALAPSEPFPELLVDAPSFPDSALAVLAPLPVPSLLTLSFVVLSSSSGAMAVSALFPALALLIPLT